MICNLDFNVAVKETLFEQTQELTDNVNQLFKDQSTAELKMNLEKLDKLNGISQTIKEFLRQLRETKSKTEYLSLRDRMIKGNMNPAAERHQSINTFFKDQKVDIKTIENLSVPVKQADQNNQMKRTSNEYSPSNLQKKAPVIKNDRNDRADLTAGEKQMAKADVHSQLDLEEDPTNNFGTLHTEKSSSINELKDLNTMITSLKPTNQVDTKPKQSSNAPYSDPTTEEPLKKNPPKSLFSKQINDNYNAESNDGTSVQNGLYSSSIKDQPVIGVKAEHLRIPNLVSENLDSSSCIEKNAPLFHDDTVEGLKAINEFRRPEKIIREAPRAVEPFVPVFLPVKHFEPVDFSTLFPVNSTVKNIKKFNPQISERIDIEKMKERVKIVHKPAPVIMEAPRPALNLTSQTQDLKILQDEIQTLKEQLKMQKQEHTSSVANIQRQTFQEKELETLKLKEKYERMLRDKEAEIKLKMDELIRLKDSQAKSFYDRNKDEYRKQDLNLLKNEMTSLNSTVNKLQDLNVD